MENRPKAFTVLGIIFLVLGTISLLSVAQGWFMAHAVIPSGGLYGLLDMLVAYGFFARQWWLRPAFGLNVAGQLVLLAVRAIYAPTPYGALFFAIFGAAVAIGIFWYVNSRRNILRYDQASYVLFALFALTWVGGFSYALSSLIPSL